MFCQVCGASAPSTYVAFYWNIGALILRWHKHIKGDMCKSCIHKHFWEYTLINVTLGWWGVISLFVTPCFIVNNLVRYIVAMIKLAKSPKEAVSAQPQQKVEPRPDAKFFLHIGPQELPLRGGDRVELGGRGLAEVALNPNNADMLGLKNISDKSWTATTPDGTVRMVDAGRSIRLIAGTQFQFGDASGEIR